VAVNDARVEAGPLEAPHPLMSQSSKMNAVLDLVARVASKPVDVLLLGESGTGKELVAKTLHRSSPRKDKPFIAFNVSAVPAELIEAELFGAEKGSYTGAVESRPGKFEVAADGTLFLDEIGEMSPEMQAKLLRVLQEREFERIGSHTPTPMRARIIAATHRHLDEEVKQKRFREDLYYRLNVFPIRIPTLRERQDDIRGLAIHFASEEGKALRGQPYAITDAATAWLETQPWPGNVRELKNTISRAVILSVHETLDASDFSSLEHTMPESAKRLEAVPSPAPPPVQPALNLMSIPLEELIAQRLQPFVVKFCEGPTGDLYKLVQAQMERALFRLVLDRTRGNQLRAADILGLNRNTLRKKLRELGISAK
jgi:two-component system, NtrC family, nitrogen regulation response regulator GlnG